MKKQEIYVPIANKKEAKRAKAVLEAMGEKIDERYFRSSYDENEGGLYFNEKYKTWVIAISFRHSYNVRTKTTLKQLIEMLVSGQQAEPEKIAVHVDNEKEFNALMKYYDSLGISPLTKIYNSIFTVIDKSVRWVTNKSNYKIIPFSEFAKEHGIRVPLLVSEDGVELFDGDEYFCVSNATDWNDDLNDGNWHIRNAMSKPFNLFTDSAVIKYPKNCKAFTNLQDAIDWIEAQKPKVIEYNVPNSNYTLSITKDEVRGFQKLSYLDFNDIKAIHKAMEELNS